MSCGTASVFSSSASNGAGAFLMSVNDGSKLNTILSASTFLRERLSGLMKNAAECGDADQLPSMSTVLETHYATFTNTFSPMVPTAYDYINNGVTSGGNIAMSTDSTIVFELHQASDFVNDIKLSVRLPTVECAGYAQVFAPESSAEYVFGLVHKYLTFGDDNVRGDIAQVNSTGSYRIGARIDDIEDYDETSPYGYFFGFSRKDGEIIPIRAELTSPQASDTDVKKLGSGVSQWYNMSLVAVNEWIANLDDEKNKYPAIITVDNIPLSKFICDKTGLISYQPYSIDEFKAYFVKFSLLQPSKKFRNQPFTETGLTGGCSNLNSLSDINYYRVKNDVGYIDKPLNGLIKKVTFTCGNSELDSYDNFGMKVEQEVFTLPNKRKALLEMIGQEQELTAYGASYKVNPIKEIGGVYHSNERLSAIHRNCNDNLSSSRNYWGSAMRQCYKLYGGLQTAETRKKAAIVSSNLNFWFNKSMAFALPTVALSYANRNINIDFNSIESILYEETVTSIRFTQLNSATSINFISPDLYDLSGNPLTWAVNSIPNSKIIYRPFRNETRRFTNLDQPQINIDVCSVYVDPMIHLLYLKKVGFNLVTVHRCESYPLHRLSSTSNKIDISSLKWMVHVLAFAAFPVVNNSFSNPHRHQTWDSPFVIIPQNTDIKHTTAINMIDNVRVQENGDEIIENNMPHVTTVVTQTMDVMPTVCLREYPVLEEVKLDSHGFILRGGNMSDFDQYAATVRGDRFFNPASGIGLINFSIENDPKQPTGWFNFSRAKNSNLVIKPACYYDFLDEYYNDASINVRICGLAYNVLLIASGMATMRFTT